MFTAIKESFQDWYKKRRLDRVIPEFFKHRKEQKDLKTMLANISNGDWPFNFRKEDVKVRNEYNSVTLVPRAVFIHTPTGVRVVRNGDLLQTLGDTSRLVVWIDMHDRINTYLQKGGKLDAPQ